MSSTETRGEVVDLYPDRSPSPDAALVIRANAALRAWGYRPLLDQESPATWLLTLADGPDLVVEADGFTIENGDLVLLRGTTRIAGYAASEWRRIVPNLQPAAGR